MLAACWDALGLYRHSEPSAPATHLYRNLYHLPPFISSFKRVHLNVGSYEQQISVDWVPSKTSGDEEELLEDRRQIR
jgi:hypothetical protein